ncbi:Acetyl-CoA synthetase [Ceratobasidium theobromae]|uniref:Acetyl-CoA synthetase n=1 Tax=Ceratobasidium theobromae TaxID=1582974 RepID=A0A5N5Q970_9AGAM|nr:Acetyl-CoA synthetase [Ceratobasidium theobromae]
MSRNPDGRFSSIVPPIAAAALAPTDLSIPQFILDSTHPLRPIRETKSPWFIEDEIGREIGYEEVRSRTWGLANALKARWPSIGEFSSV